jgi:hypothetical protein
MTKPSIIRRVGLGVTAVTLIAGFGACSSDSKTATSSTSSSSSSSSSAALSTDYCTKVAHITDNAPQDTESMTPEQVKAGYVEFQKSSAADLAVIEKEATGEAKQGVAAFKAFIAATTASGVEDLPTGLAADAKLVAGSTRGCGWTSTAVTAQEYAFSGLPTAPSPGTYVLNLTNGGKEPHLLSVVRVKDGVTKTIDEIFAESTGGPPPDIEDLGPPAFATPGTTGTAVVDLTKPGRYIYLCPLPAPDGAPHFTKGMKGEFTIK